MFAPTLLKKRPAMPREASPADNDEAEAPGAENAPKKRRALRFQYGTGDQPLDGYTIKRGVGRGGFGEVYFATSEAGKEVALKLIRRNLDIELRGVRQCLNLKHPNLVALYDLRSDAVDDQWVVMEYVAGDSLEDVLARSPEGLPVEEALAWLRGIAAGVGALHEAGIVHRDLKPGNIYLERSSAPLEQRVKIGDYGLSKFISTSRRSGQTESVGTVHYMAPEIAGGRYGREIDTYALGIILYEMLTGHVPFEGESVGEVLMKHLTAEPDLAKVDEPYRTIIARALAKDPESRLKSVDELLALLPGAAPPAGAVRAGSSPTAGAGVEDDPARIAAAAAAPANEQPWSPVSRPPHTQHPKPDREPLWGAMVDLVETGQRNWAAWDAPPLMKGLVVFGVVGVLFISGAWVAVPVAILPFYLVYYVVWALFFQSATPVADAGAPVGPNGRPLKRPKPSAPRRPRYNWRLVAQREQAARPLREKAASLTGSMVTSALVAIVASTIAAPILSSDTAADPLVFGVWLAAVSTLGSWGVLLSSAFADHRIEDHTPRRGLNLLAGLGLGAAAAALIGVLGQGIPYWDTVSVVRDSALLEKSFDINLYQGVSGAGDVIAVPALAAVVYFGLMFLVVRWWRSTEYVRRSRIGFGKIFAVAVFAWLLSTVAWFPQPAGMVLAGVIALATQAASPWCPPSRRVALARGEMPTQAHPNA